MKFIDIELCTTLCILNNFSLDTYTYLYLL